MKDQLARINAMALDVKNTSNPNKAKRLAGEVLEASNQLLAQLITHALNCEQHIKQLNDDVKTLNQRLTELES